MLFILIQSFRTLLLVRAQILHGVLITPHKTTAMQSDLKMGLLRSIETFKTTKVSRLPSLMKESLEAACLELKVKIISHSTIGMNLKLSDKSQ
jgi:hypothetical protein